MQAMAGLTLSGLRTRVIECALVVALALSALVLFAPNARAGEPPLKVLIGSGTDVTFGYSQQVFNENYPLESPLVFELNGAGLHYYQKLQAKQATKLLEPSNWELPISDACPFETTNSYIGNGPVGKALEAVFVGTHGEAPCAYHNVQGFALQHEYRRGQSQLENVLEVIAHNNSGLAGAIHPVQLVVMDMGVNDLLHAVAKCEKEVAEGKWTGASGEPPLTECEIVSLGAVIERIDANIAAALYAIRNGSKFGGVNYTGKITFAGPYNPFGAVFTPGVELNPGSNFLTLVVNLSTKKAVEPFGVCYVNPQSNPASATSARAFNPLIDGKPELEPERLQKWTNMANTSTAFNPLALFDQYKGKNGPDIHPTAAGYEELANLLEQECPSRRIYDLLRTRKWEFGRGAWPCGRAPRAVHRTKISYLGCSSSWALRDR
jgi:hypothetical protein